MNSTSDAQKPSFFTVIMKMVALSYRTRPIAYIAFLVSSMLFTALLVVDLHFVRRLLDNLPLFVDGSISLRSVLATIIALGSVNILCMVMNGCANLLYEYLEKHTSARMTSAMSEKATRLDLIQFESSILYDSIEKAVNGREKSFAAMEAVVFSLIFHGGYFLFLGLYLLAIEPLLVLGIFAAFLPVALSRYIRTSAFYKTETRVAPLRRQFNHYEECLTDRRYFKETRTSNAVPFFENLYKDSLKRYGNEIWSTEMRTGKIDLALRLLTLTGYAGLLALLIVLLFRGNITAGMFGAVYFAMDNIFKWFEELFGRLGGAYENAAFGSNYLLYMDSEERRYGNTTLRHDRGIELRNVSFIYPGTEYNAVDGISLTIEPRETVAIVGENGAGKTTLVRLITGMFLPTGGTVRIGGADVGSGTRTSLYRGLSAVFQRFQRYRMTLQENVELSDIDKTPGGAETALSHAGFPSDDSRLSLNTMLSKEFGGTDLSGGEWQRVAIARGLYRRHDFIVLDEPTASIDPVEETAVYRKFAQAASEKTAILVTHRLGSARIADRIIVMKDGRIVEQGSHQNLMAEDGIYARMFKAQATWYDRDAGA